MMHVCTGAFTIMTEIQISESLLCESPQVYIAHTNTHKHTHTLTLSHSFIHLSLSLSPGFPEYVSYPEFCRLYGALMPPGEGNSSMSDKEKAEFILSCAEVEKSTYRLGLSRVFFRAGTLAKLDRQVEESTHDIIVQFQVSQIP